MFKYAWHLSSVELRGGVRVPLESSVDDVGSLVDEVRHDGLVLRSVPGNVSGLSESVPVAVLVVLMEDGGLSHSPLEVGVGHGGALGESTGEVPPEEVGVVH